MAKGCSGRSKNSCDEKFTCKWDEDRKQCCRRGMPFVLLGAAAGVLACLLSKKKTSLTTQNPIRGCTDPIAVNFEQTASIDDGSCKYFCNDVTAENFRAPEKCKYAKYLCIRGKCTKSSYGVSILQCTPWCYCDDPKADNYMVKEPCKYSQYVCRAGSCVRQTGQGDTLAECQNKCRSTPPGPPLCLDQNALNFGQPAPCIYAQIEPKLPPISPPTTFICQHCKDPKATNYDANAICHNPSMCSYIQAVCSDPTASNYNQVLPCTYGCTPGKIETVIPCPLSGGKMWAVKSWRECKQDGSKFEVKNAKNGCFWELEDEVADIYICAKSNQSYLDFRWRLVAAVPYQGFIDIEAFDVNKKKLYSKTISVSLNPLQRTSFRSPVFNGKVDYVQINTRPYILTTSGLLPNYPKKTDQSC